MLTKMGLIKDIEEGRILCSNCGVQLSVSTVQFILPLPNGATRLVCDSVECADSLATQREYRA